MEKLHFKKAFSHFSIVSENKNTVVPMIPYSRTCIYLYLHAYLDSFLPSTTFLVSKDDVNGLWEAFNDIAEGFGLSSEELVEICSTLKDSLEVHSNPNPNPNPNS
jgi:hypothetical protein